MGDDTQLILASASPRRRELLRQIGVRFQLHPVDLDESVLPDETPRAYVSRLALAKARAAQSALATPLPVLGSDTTVVIDDKILGKPVNRADGLRMLAALSGRQHTVFSAVALIQGARREVRVNLSRVRLRTLSENERIAYWATGEPADKAGSYAIQGLGASFVSEIQGSHSGIMGLPLFETAELLALFGINIY